MAKLNELKNPLAAGSVDVLNPGDWIRSIGFVAWTGIIIALGVKALEKADELIPGNVTPTLYTKAVEKAEAKGDVVL